MKNALTIGVVIFATVVVVYYWRAPTRQASIGPVTLSFRELSPSNNQHAFFALSNGGPFELQCTVRTEVEESGRWRRPPQDGAVALPMLSPHASTNAWRIAVQCMRHYTNTDSGRRRGDFDWYVRKKAFLDTKYSERISR